MANARPNSPEPLVRTVSAECSASLKHPTPDLQPIRNLSSGNIEKLEITAQQMKFEPGLEEEIRGITSRMEASESRISSVRSLHNTERDMVLAPLSRASTRSSYAKSIVDMNHDARSGGYLPHTLASTAVGPLRSDSLSRYPQGLSRASSTMSRKSLQVSCIKQCQRNEESLDTGKDAVRKLGGSTSSVSLSHLSRSPTLSNRDRVLRDHESDADVESMDIDKEGSYCPKENKDAASIQDPSMKDGIGTISSNSSNYVSNEDENLFVDFDGNHHSHADRGDKMSAYFNHTDGNNGNQEALSGNFRTSLESKSNYPARIPKLLNLPKRLSQTPNASLPNDRRSKALQHIIPKARNSYSWSADGSGNGEITFSNGAPSGMAEDKLDAVHIPAVEKLPPQLRASAFFDQIPRPLKLQAKGETAVERLNYMLEASTCAPADAFTNQFTPNCNNTDVSRQSVKAKHDRKSPYLATVTPTANQKTRRSFLFFRRKSGVDLVKNNIEDSGMEQLSDRDDSESVASGTSTEEENYLDTNDNLISSSKGGKSKIESEGGIDHEGAPSTLLAELQIRKERLQKRTRTAPTAPYNDLHTTLLQLDAVAQIEKRRRVGQRIKLAWEEHDIGTSNADDDDDDEDVPLGVLFGSKNKNGGDRERDLSDWNRPLGLIQSRDLEDNEPLSVRRKRLYMDDLYKSVPHLPKQCPSSRTPEIQCPSASESDDVQNETLAQRMRRLRREKDLTAAFKGEGKRKADEGNNNNSSSTLRLEGMDHVSLSPIAISEMRISEDEGETLGQRRKRLQAKKSAGSRKFGHDSVLDSGGREPELFLKKTRSMVDLFPNQPTAGFRRVSNDELRASLAPGSLLQKNEMRQERHSFFISEQNRRSSYGNDKLLPHSQTSRTPSPSAPIQRQLSSGVRNDSAFACNPSASVFTGKNTGVGSPVVLRDTELMSNTAEGKKPQLTATLNASNSELNRDFYIQQAPVSTAQLANHDYFGPKYSQRAQIPITQVSSTYEPTLGIGMGSHPVTSLDTTTNFPTNSVAMDSALDPRQQVVVSHWRQSIA